MLKQFPDVDSSVKKLLYQNLCKCILFVWSTVGGMELVWNWLWSDISLYCLKSALLLTPHATLTYASIHTYTCKYTFTHSLWYKCSPLLSHYVCRGLLWAKSTLSSADSQNRHRAALAYASDASMAGVIMFKYPGMKTGLITSLDHSISFHESVQSDKWHLFVTECERAVGTCAYTVSR